MGIGENGNKGGKTTGEGEEKEDDARRCKSRKRDAQFADDEVVVVD